MRNKNRSKKYEAKSSSDSKSSDSDSSSSSSDSDGSSSSPTPKKSRKDVKKKRESKEKRTKHEISDEENYQGGSSKKSKPPVVIPAENYTTKGSSRQNIEKSKWDSPQEKPQDKHEKRSEKHRRSDSLDAATRKVKSTADKEQDLIERRQNDRQRSYNHNRSEEGHRDKRDKRYDKDRNEYNDDKNRKDRGGGDDRDYNTKRYHYDRHSNNDRKDYNRDDREYNSRKYNHDRSNSADRNRHQNKYRNRRHRSRSGSLDHKDIKWGKEGDSKSNKTEHPKEKDKPNFGLSGKLTEETNTYRGIVIKYSEPPEARKPKRRWRLYPFKGEKALQTLYIHRESAYLIGRERKIVDLPIDHPSCSKQHAVLQYRLVPFTRDDGSTGKRVRPYIIDLDSANGTFINNKRIDSKKYVELLEKDVIKFGYSSREYVLLHENSKDEVQDDDVKDEEVHEPVKKEKDEGE